MKKLINSAFIYAILGLVAGVFYREATKMLAFEGHTVLSVLHTHIFVLGMFFFLIVALFEHVLTISSHPRYRLFLLFYHHGLALTIVMFTIRGTVQLLETPLSKGVDMSIAGFAGIGHILLTVGLVMFFIILRKQADQLSQSKN